MFKPWVRPVVVLSVVALAGCGGGGGGPSNDAAVSGTISFPSSLTGSGGGAFPSEAEPNDSFDQAERPRLLVAGAPIRVQGTLGDDDRFDGFSLIARERVRVRVEFDVEGGSAALALYDPIGLQFVELEPSGASNRFEFVQRGAEQLVAIWKSGAPRYRLTLSPEAIDGALDLGQAGVRSTGEPRLCTLGALELGEKLELSMHLDGALRSAIRVLVQCPTAMVLQARVLSSDGSVELSDATSDANSPIPIERSDADGYARSAIRARTWVALDVRSSGGSGFQTVELSTAPAFVAAGPSARVASVQLEPQFAVSTSPNASIRRFYGEPVLPARRGEFIVDAHDDADLSSVFESYGLREVERIPHGAMLVQFDLPPVGDELSLARSTVALTQLVAARPEVEYAELNLLRQRCAKTPNDPLFPLQWHYQLIQLPAAWDLTTGDTLGHGTVTVAVIDTGRTNHPDLAGRQVGGFDFISDAANAGDGDGLDADPTDVGDGNGTTPSSWHGTHVAGTIGANTDNATGVSGVTWVGDIMHLRVLGKQGGSDFDIANAILYAANLANDSNTTPGFVVDVINMSLGGPGSTTTAQNAVTAAFNQGVAIFAAAGNNNSTQLFFPASYTHVTSVSAVDFNANKAPYSNHNSTVDICAPGGDTSVDVNGDGFADGVLSTLNDQQGNPIFAFYQGTSMACPHAAGVAALMKAKAKELGQTLTPTQIETILENTATDLGVAGRDDIFGFGLINAFAAVNAVANGAGGNPVLGLSATDLKFLPGVVSAKVLVNNDGGGKLLVDDPTVQTTSGGNWLSAVRVVSASAASDTESIQVDVDRTGLADGNYDGEVDVTSNGGPLTKILVTLNVNSTVVVPVDIFVLLVNAKTFDTVGQAVVNPTTTLDWKMLNLPAGSYYLVAGSDDDHDNVIGGAGDQYFGVFPTTGQPSVVKLADGTVKKHLDFSVVDTFAPPPSASGGGHRTFKLLH